MHKRAIKECIYCHLKEIGRDVGQFGFTFEEIMEKNIEKLKARYGDKFTEKSALNRDLEQERKTLEDK